MGTNDAWMHCFGRAHRRECGKLLAVTTQPERRMLLDTAANLLTSFSDLDGIVAAAADPGAALGASVRAKILAGSGRGARAVVGEMGSRCVADPGVRGARAHPLVEIVFVERMPARSPVTAHTIPLYGCLSPAPDRLDP